MEFKDLVYSKRKALNLSMEELAKKVGVSKATVQRWESGEIKNVRRDKIARIADALETTPAYLMGWDEEMQDRKKEFQPFDLDALKKIIVNDTKLAYQGLSSLCKIKRIEKDWTEKKVAELSYISLDEYLNFENNNLELDINRIDNILKALDISIEFALGFISAMLDMRDNKINIPDPK